MTNLVQKRRQILLSALLTACGGRVPSRSASSPNQPSASDVSALLELEAATGGRLGVFAVDLGSGRQLAHRADERFAMCSTFKWVLAAAVLQRVDRNTLRLDQPVPFGSGDLLEYAPITSKHVAEGALTVDSLAEASVISSDNTAANLLLEQIGGPAGLTRFIRSSGDEVTRLDRNEPTLNTNDRDDPRDTTSPRAMASLLRRLLCDTDLLSSAGRARLLGWLRACETGNHRVRAGFPPDWPVGDKTGSGRRGAVNDVVIAVPPGRAPILVAAYLSDSNAELSTLETAHAELGRLIARQL